jgi:hypothetical protein
MKESFLDQAHFDMTAAHYIEEPVNRVDIHSSSVVMLSHRVVKLALYRKLDPLPQVVH